MGGKIFEITPNCDLRGFGCIAKRGFEHPDCDGCHRNTNGKIIMTKIPVHILAKVQVMTYAGNSLFLN